MRIKKFNENQQYLTDPVDSEFETMIELDKNYIDKLTIQLKNLANEFRTIELIKERGGYFFGGEPGEIFFKWALEFDKAYLYITEDLICIIPEYDDRPFKKLNDKKLKIENIDDVRRILQNNIPKNWHK